GMRDEPINTRDVIHVCHLLLALLTLCFLLDSLPAAHFASYPFVPTDVPVPGAFDTGAYGINAHGQIVGYYSDSTGGQAFSRPPTRRCGSGLPSSPCCSWPQAAYSSSRACA